MSTVAAVPPDTDVLPAFPTNDTGADVVDYARNLVARNPRIANAWKVAFFGE
jgi:hypothetical protein